MNTIVLALAFAVLAVLVYMLWKPMLPRRPVPPGEGKIYFFYTDWCGFSQKAMPEWDALEATLKDTPIFGTTRVVPVRVDADADRATAELYGVDAFPTIKLETSTGLYEYSKRPTKDGLVQFLRESLGKESASL